jgi:hypothetical protein
MERYIIQLIEDLQAAHSLQVSSDYTSLNRIGTMEKFFGINRSVFPPAEMLSETQLVALSDAIIALLDAHRYIVHVAMMEGVPKNVLYQRLIRIWTKDTYYCTSGLMGLDSCDPDPGTCGLKEWCRCTWFECDDDFVLPQYNGIYDDEGNKIDIDTIPIPELCLSCRSYLTEDWDENILCSLTRADDYGDEEFRCYSYKKIRNL